MEDTNLTYQILPEIIDNYDIGFKLIIIGDSGVGKSSLTAKATKNIFDENYTTTIGFEFFSFNIKINNKIIKLKIWDTCGQEIYRSLTRNFYRAASMAIMVYSIDQKASYDNIDLWVKDLKTHANPDAKVILIGNKIDLEDQRKVSKETAESFAKENDFNGFYETSAKNGINAKEIFVDAAKILYKEYMIYLESMSRSSDNSYQRALVIPDTCNASEITSAKNKGGCCS